jgi:hypothetical protein
LLELPLFELLLLAVFSLLEVELVLEAGEDKFCEAVEEPVAAFPGGEVLTERGDVRPELLVAVLVLCAVESGGVLLVGAPLVLRSCGEATPVEEVESAYLQLAEGLSMPGLCAPGLAWCRWVVPPWRRCGCSWV